MKTISTAEARKRFAEITDEVRQSKTSYSIVRHGKEVARLVPPTIDASLLISPQLKKSSRDFLTGMVRHSEN